MPSSAPIRIIGIDPGSQVTGWGIVEGVGQRVTEVAHGTIRMQSGSDLPERLRTIFNALVTIIETHRPHEMAVEEVFVSHNVQSALKLGHARGAAIVAGAQCGLPVAEYTALQVKKAVVGYGRAEKKQVQEMIKMLLSLPKAPAQDAADALAIAMCHINQRQWSQTANTAMLMGGRR
uniref:Crossover junction endodeoxyribonuclease RuvC n=1 Tax=Magnetococcus massalia (strain MO-1) TaxID=451514 RepID=A0A1S7LMS8_MAGMO|nr:Crossover junction endodeoxyribonuclease ruvC (Holliday junction nuclease ruvC) [Candidatus Magnetococcus massalia]